MTEQNEQENVETPVMTDELKNDPDALYQLLGAVVHRLGTHSITLTAKERQVEYVLRADEGDDHTLIISSKVHPEWAEESPAS